MSTPNAALLATCIRKWASARTIKEQNKVSTELSKYDKLWTKEERAIIKNQMKHFKPASR